MERVRQQAFYTLAFFSDNEIINRAAKLGFSLGNSPS
jgi:hypothetical protein